MIPNDKQQRVKVIDYMLITCEQSIDKLSKWESNFISSISQQFEYKNNLTDSQCEILEKIYDKLE